METLIIIVIAGLFGFIIYRMTKKTEVKKPTGTGSGGSGGGTPWREHNPDRHRDPHRPEELRDADSEDRERML